MQAADPGDPDRNADRAGFPDHLQPWIVEGEGQELRIYRYQKPSKRGIMPADKVAYYNRIDIGIFLLFLEVCPNHQQIGFDRVLCEGPETGEKTLTAIYTIRDNDSAAAKMFA